MVDNCNKFHLVKSGETCPAIQKEFGVSLEDLAKWSEYRHSGNCYEDDN